MVGTCATHGRNPQVHRSNALEAASLGTRDARVSRKVGRSARLMRALTA
jgi:hypothetical protein